MAYAIAMVLGCLAATTPTVAKPKPAAVSPRLRALADTCQARRGIATKAFTRHLSDAKRTQKAWAVAVIGSDATARKTRAEQIAKAAGATLRSVDAGALVGKYIGETEKNLERLLAKAKADGVVLFFDEADALFGKRSEVHDAHDRYASSEASTISAKLAEHADLVVLGTRSSIDDASAKLLADAQVVSTPKPPKGPVPPLPWHRLCWPPR